MHHHFVEVLALPTMAKVEKPWIGLEDKRSRVQINITQTSEKFHFQ
jgi:hypothetical protein